MLWPHKYQGCRRSKENKKLLRILPPLTVGKKEIDQFIESLQKVLELQKEANEI